MHIEGIQDYVCQYIGHEGKKVIGFCLNLKCQTHSFCLDCGMKGHLHDRHKDDCQSFENLIQIFKEFVGNQSRDLQSIRQLQQYLMNYVGQVNKMHNCDNIKRLLQNLSSLLNDYFSEISERESFSSEIITLLKNSEYGCLKTHIRKIKEYYNFITKKYNLWLFVFHAIENSYVQLFDSYNISKDAGLIAQEINSCLTFCKDQKELFLIQQNQQNCDICDIFAIFRAQTLFKFNQINEKLKNFEKLINLEIDRLQCYLQNRITNIILEFPQPPSCAEQIKYQRQLQIKEVLSTFLNLRVQFNRITMKLNQQFSNFYYLIFIHHSQEFHVLWIKLKFKYVQQLFYFDSIFQLIQYSNLKQDQNFYFTSIIQFFTYNRRSRIKYNVDQNQLPNKKDDIEHQFNLYNFEIEQQVNEGEIVQYKQDFEYPEFQIRQGIIGFKFKDDCENEYNLYDFGVEFQVDEDKLVKYSQDFEFSEFQEESRGITGFVSNDDFEFQFNLYNFESEEELNEGEIVQYKQDFEHPEFQVKRIIASILNDTMAEEKCFNLFESVV